MGEYMAALRAGYKNADEHNDAVNRAEREKSMAEQKGTSEHRNIGAALAAAQGEFTNPPRNKTVKIPTKTGGSFTFQYADLAGIMDTVRPVLSRHGLAIAQPLGNNGKDEITLKTILLHASGERIEGSEFPVCSDKGDAKDIGARITYMRRYALCAMLGIVADDDEDVASPTIDTHKPPVKTAPRPAKAPETRDEAAAMEQRINNTPLEGAKRGTRYAFADKPKGSVLAGWENKQKFWMQIEEMSDAELEEAHRTLAGQADWETKNGKDTKWTVKDMAAVEVEMRARGIEIPSY